MALIQDTPTSLPRSNAKRAWGLLQDVKQAMLDEPSRADMRHFRGYASPNDGGPACGTVGCFWGWTCMLVKPYAHPVRVSARGLLGDCDFTFGGGGHFVFNSGSGDACATTTPGTLAHAKAVVRRINRFMRKNERILRNKKV